jgi:hypothetical protein
MRRHRKATIAMRLAMHADHAKGEAFVAANGLPPRAEAILRRIPENVPILGIEIGVFRAVLSKVLLQHRPQLHLCLVDLWCRNPSPNFAATNVRTVQKVWNHGRWPRIFRFAMNNVAFAWDRVTPIRADSVAAATTFHGRPLDFAFIDDDHSYSGCLRSITAWFPKVKPGGWICGHDYNHPDPRFKFHVTEAVHAFFDPLKLLVELDLDCTWFVRVP